MNASNKLKIVISGIVAADPFQGGATWSTLQYVLGFKRLGHEVWLIEPVKKTSLQPKGVALAESVNADYFHSVVNSFGLADTSALLLAGTTETVGVTYDKLRQAAAEADLLLNISGMLTDEALLGKISRRVYLDIDPAFNQLWQTAQNIDMRFGGHTQHVTIGQAIGQPECLIPTCGLNWLKTLQPIVLEQWPKAEPAAIRYNGFTTVGNWRGYGSIEYHDFFYGQKVHSLRNFYKLPTLTAEKFMLAMSIDPAERKDHEALKANRWKLLSPLSVADTPEHYREFVRGSKAEFGIAKSGYVLSRCGWFSDRSLCYLASGRPVLAQETGFAKYLPAGRGLLAFSTIEEILTGIDAINSDYAGQAQAAREIAEEFFDSDKVLPRLLNTVGADA